METVSVMPVSLVSSQRGFKGKNTQKGMHLMMLKGTLTQLSERLGKDHG
jgi:hypothetical protein